MQITRQGFTLKQLRLLRGHMSAFGCTDEEIYTMCAANPAFIVGLEVPRQQQARATH